MEGKEASSASFVVGSERRSNWVQVRNAQLDKEAGELRLENAMLSETVEVNRVAAVNNEEVGGCLTSTRRR